MDSGVTPTNHPQLKYLIDCPSRKSCTYKNPLKRIEPYVADHIIGHIVCAQSIDPLSDSTPKPDRTKARGTRFGGYFSTNISTETSVKVQQQLFDCSTNLSHVFFSRHNLFSSSFVMINLIMPDRVYLLGSFISFPTPNKKKQKNKINNNAGCAPMLAVRQCWLCANAGRVPMLAVSQCRCTKRCGS
jgi:hypothetical protein